MGVMSNGKEDCAMKIKKLLAVLAAGAMLTGTAGCGKAQTESKAESSQGGGTAEVTPAARGLDKEFTTNCTGEARVTVDGTRFMVGGKELWFNGANTPWDKWNDFGGGFSFEFWNDHFSKLHEAGVNGCRVWIVCNGDVGMEISADGTFTGATDKHWEDLDELFSLAEYYQIYIMATVQSFDNFKDTNNNYQAWRTLIQDDEKTDQFIDNYLVPLVKRYDACDYLWSIDLCNEPDWIVEEEECGMLSWDGLEKYYAKACSAIHANSDVLVTVGMGMIKYNSDNQQRNVISDENLKYVIGGFEGYDPELAYVDFYSTHWYSWMIPNWGVIYENTPVDFGLDGTKPAVIGEMPAKDGTDRIAYDVAEAYEKAYSNGYNGVFAWKTSGSDDGCGLWLDVKPAIDKMMTICPEKIFPLS